MSKSAKTITYYDILQVSITATPEEIKKSYEQLVMEYADKYRGKPEVELFLNHLFDAYSVLSNPEKRFAYNQSLPKTAQISLWDTIFRKKKAITPKDFEKQSPTFTQLLDFNWEELETKIDPIKNQTPEQKKAFWDAMGFKAIIILLFLIFILLLFWSLS